jgi:hypothetical protein
MSARKKNKEGNFIRLEPAAVFDRAIISEDKDGFLTYSYRRLIAAVIEMNIDPEDAEEYIEYNIERLCDYTDRAFAIDRRRK